MDIEAILAYRPAAATTAAIKESLRQIETAISETSAIVAGHSDLRKSLLLVGNATDILAMEAKLAEAHINLEQLCELQTIVRAQLPIAEEADEVARLRASVAHADDLSRAVCERWRTEYPPLATALASLLQAEKEAMAVQGRSVRDWFRKADLARAAGVPQPITMDLLLPGCPRGSFHEMIPHLPGIRQPDTSATHNMHIRYFPPAEPPAAPPREPASEDPRRHAPPRGYEIRTAGTAVPNNGAGTPVWRPLV